MPHGAVGEGYGVVRHGVVHVHRLHGACPPIGRVLDARRQVDARGALLEAEPGTAQDVVFAAARTSSNVYEGSPIVGAQSMGSTLAKAVYDRAVPFAVRQRSWPWRLYRSSVATASGVTYDKIALVGDANVKWACELQAKPRKRSSPGVVGAVFVYEQPTSWARRSRALRGRWKSLVVPAFVWRSATSSASLLNLGMVLRQRGPSTGCCLLSVAQTVLR